MLPQAVWSEEHELGAESCLAESTEDVCICMYTYIYIHVYIYIKIQVQVQRPIDR